MMSRSLWLVSTRECLGFWFWSTQCSGCGILHCGVCCLCSKEEADGDQGQACFQLVAKVSSILKMFQNRAWVNRRLTKFSWRPRSWSVLSCPQFWFSFKLLFGDLWFTRCEGAHGIYHSDRMAPDEIANYSGVLLKLKFTYVCGWSDNHWVQRAGQAVEWWFRDWVHHRAIWGVPHRSQKRFCLL